MRLREFGRVALDEPRVHRAGQELRTGDDSALDVQIRGRAGDRELGERDSLGIDWAARHPRGNLWLNPPFARVASWMAKCHHESKRRQGLILSLTLASVGSRWFIDHVHGHALVMPLCPRVTFVGEPAPFNRDLMLCAWGEGLVGFVPWVWR